MMKKLLLSFTGMLCIGALAAQTYESQRPAPEDRLFVSEAVEQTIAEVQEMLDGFGDEEPVFRRRALRLIGLSRKRADA